MKVTDTKIKHRFAELQKMKSRFLAGKRPQGNIDLAEQKRIIEISESLLISDWNEVVARKRAGELTDTSRTDQVKKIASDLAKMHGFPVRFFVKESPPDETHYARWWFVNMMYGANTGNFDYQRWERLADRITDELKQFKFVSRNTKSRGWGTDPPELPPDYYDRDYSKPGAPEWDDNDLLDPLSEDDYDNEDEGPDGITPADLAPPLAEKDWKPTDPYQRRYVGWCVDTLLWDWPSESREKSGSKRRTHKPASDK